MDAEDFLKSKGDDKSPYGEVIYNYDTAKNEWLDPLFEEYAGIKIVEFINWIVKQNLMICEGVDGYNFRSSMTGGEKYTAEQLLEKYLND